MKAKRTKAAELVICLFYILEMTAIMIYGATDHLLIIISNAIFSTVYLLIT